MQPVINKLPMMVAAVVQCSQCLAPLATLLLLLLEGICVFSLVMGQMFKVEIGVYVFAGKGTSSPMVCIQPFARVSG